MAAISSSLAPNPLAPLTTAVTQPASRPTAPVQAVIFRNNKTISINDCIYVSAPWTAGGGEPYLIGRVMEFVTVPIEWTPSSSSSSNTRTTDVLHVRTNLFLRSRDVTGRIAADPRLLVATMNSEVFSLETIRGVCEVRHRDLIGDGTAADIAAWKKQEDHFFFHQLYDRYIHRFYEAIPTERIKNAPDPVIDFLRKKYSFIITEPGQQNDLCEARRACATCDAWAASAESVQCDTCKQFWHLTCLNPPLAMKPPKGYGWTCAPCSKRHELLVKENSTGVASSVAPTRYSSRPGQENNENKVKNAGKSREVRNLMHTDQARRGLTPEMTGGGKQHRTLNEQRGTKCFEGWPYRYFGQFTDAWDVLDPHDSIYPRAETRKGPKFQADLASWEEQLQLGKGVRPTSSKLPSPPGEDSHSNSNGSNGNPSPEKAADSSGHASQSFYSMDAVSSTPSKRRVIKVKRSTGSVAGTPTPSAPGTPAASVVSLPDTAEGAAAPAAPTPPAAPTVAPQPGEVPAPAPPPVPAIAIKRKPGRPRKHPLPESRASTPGGLPDRSGPSMLSTLKIAGAGGLGSNGTAMAESVSMDLTPIPDLTPLPDRGSDETVEVIFSPNLNLPDKIVNAVLKAARNHMATAAGISDFNVDFMDRALALLCKYKSTPSLALAEFTKSTPEQLKLVSWTAREIKALEAAVKDASLDLKQVKKVVPTKNYADIVRAYYGWKGRKYGHAWESKRRGNAAPADEVERPLSMTRAVSPSLSVFGGSSTSGVISCSTCHVHKSQIWFKGPWSWPNRAMCHDCGMYWRKYASEPPLTEPLTLEKKRSAPDDGETDGPPSKVAKTKAEKAKAEEAQEGPVKLGPGKCTMCKRMEPKKRLLVCLQCTMSVHQGCYGCAEAELKADWWLCDLCRNERTAKHRLVPSCVLCPLPRIVRKPKAGEPGKQVNQSTRGRKSAGVNAAAAAASSMTISSSSASNHSTFNPLEVLKPTEYDNWAHIICSVYIAECTFSSTDTLRGVEGAGTLPAWRYKAKCEICNEVTGACVSCAEPGCRRTFHVSCAYAAQPFYLFGFEIKPVKSVRRDSTSIVSFKAETGNMKALVWCVEHKDAAKAKTLYDLSEIDPASGLTALQAFTSTHKHVGTQASTAVDSFPILRKAKRLEPLIGTDISKEKGLPPSAAATRRKAGAAAMNLTAGEQDSHDGPSEKREQSLRSLTCFKCHSAFSPFWWPVPDSADLVCCNQCRPEVVPHVEIPEAMVADLQIEEFD